jgi:UDP-glucose 4-epimerase
VVFASSAATYGDGPQPSSETLLPVPASPYGLHKLTSEHHLRIATTIHGVPTVSLRFFNVYGPRQVPTSAYAGVISIFIERALARRPLELFGGGVATRDFVYVADIVRALIFALEAEELVGGVFNIGTGRATSVRELAETIVSVTGSTSPLLDAPARPGEALHSRAELGRIAAHGWRALTSLSEGLAATAAWMERGRSA